MHLITWWSMWFFGLASACSALTVFHKRAGTVWNWIYRFNSALDWLASNPKQFLKNESNKFWLCFCSFQIRRFEFCCDTFSMGRHRRRQRHIFKWTADDFTAALEHQRASIKKKTSIKLMNTSAMFMQWLGIWIWTFRLLKVDPTGDFNVDVVFRFSQIWFIHT